MKPKEKTCVIPRIKAILGMFGIFLTLGIITFVLLSSDYFTNPHQGLPEIKNSVLDFSSSEIGNRYTKQHMIGDYEFFYNHWIVEEDYKGAPDAKVSVPHRFKGTKINGKVLDNKGYASYRLIVTGLPLGTPIAFSNNNFIGAFYGYVNDQLIYKYGTRQKTGDCLSKGGYDFSENYIVDTTEPLVVVFEVSSSRQGGLTSPPRLVIQFNDNIPTSPSLTNSVGLFALGVTLSLFIFSFIINIETRKDKKNMFFALVMLSMSVLTIFSIDVYWRILAFIPIKTYNIIMDVNFFTNFALMFSLFFYFIKSNLIKSRKKWLVFLITMSVVSIILYFALMGSRLQIISSILQFICFFAFIYPLILDFEKGKKSNFLFVFFVFSLIVYMLCTAFDLENVISNGLEQKISLILLCINFYVIILYRRISQENSKKLISALITENEHNSVKAAALKAQIKPHFIFNSLANVQAAYKQNIALGDRALTMFSRHLRANVDAGSLETVPFSVELDNILNYIELENLRRQKPITVLLDCENIEFKVPVLSLQPFVENAFKHAHVENSDNGYIEITAYEKQSNVVVQINDNGVGFDVKAVEKTSVGLKNSCERLRLISSATVEIDSKIGAGTSIKIDFPKPL